jgi:hypothetical protein
MARLGQVLTLLFTGYTYDRRGQSGDSGRYAVACEVEDLAPMLKEFLT